MPTEPQIVERAEQPYVAIRGVVTMRTIAEIADRLPEVFGRVGAHGVEPAGAPFFKYNLIDMKGRLEIEAGVPVAAVAEAADIAQDADELLSGVLPAGRYATVTHVGHPSGLLDATAALLDWAAKRGLRWDVTETRDGEKWGCRLELYKTDPRVEPDMNNWETELAFRLAD
ncbi:GyrI-like domain-containing protein [Planotetraspora sp. GP83]|uniref:GyrI-like domain-containing protein n=1 Tax=Planotetraspora sp. GP83 TaxID=3156264 RepID=UPI003514BB63